ncbi:MAG: alpha-xylosidase [Aestuariibacter sp.]
MSEFSVVNPDWNSVAQVSITAAGTCISKGKVAIETSAGEMYISTYSTGIRIQCGTQRQLDYGMLKNLPELQECQLDSNSDRTIIRTEKQTLTIQHKPFQFELVVNGNCRQKTPNDGHFVRPLRLPPLAKLDDGWLLSFNLESNEPVYGLGEKWGKLDKRGQLIRSFNHDALGVNAEISYKNTPFCWSPEGWAVFSHTPAPVSHAVGYAPWSQRAYCALVEDEELDIFLLTSDADNKPADLLAQYTELTGRAPTPPDWSLGVILSKAYYKDAEEFIRTAQEVRENNMHCDVITLDGRAWQDTDTRFAFEWDATRYPDPGKVIEQVKALNFKICIWEYPLVSVRNPLFDKMAQNGWLIKDKRTGEAFRYQWDMSAFGEVLTPLPESGIVDFTHPDAFAFWRDAHKPLFDLGIDMIKADFGEQIEDPNMLAYNGEEGKALHNVYSLLYNRCVYEAAQKYCKSGPFLFSRSAWTGSQCYPAQWGGDPQADWGGLAANIRGGLSWGLSGAPFYATDVGGFFKDTRDPELYVRWIQASVFSAHMRLHGIGQREPWSYGEDAERAANQALRLRYQILPYLKQVMQQASKTGLPVQRPMVLAYPDDRASWAFEDQFMFGEDILVAPAYRAGGAVEVYLPAGEWVKMDDNQKFTGGAVHRFILALDEMAVFIKSGANISLAEPVYYIGDNKIESLAPLAQ